MAAFRFDSARAEIEGMRSRMLGERWDAYHYDVLSRLRTVSALVGGPGGQEINRHAVVTAIAALQTFHRGTIVALVSVGPEFQRRAAESIPAKFSLTEALKWLGDTSVTFGELVAYNASCNSVTDLVAGLNAILGFDVTAELEGAVKPEDKRSGRMTAPKLVPDASLLLERLAEAFRLRHIFAHEAAFSVTVDDLKCKELLHAVRAWVEAIDAILWDSVYRHVPLTQREMNTTAQSEVVTQRLKLAEAMRSLRKHVDRKQRRWLAENHRTWRKAAQDWVRGSYGSMDGTMWPAVAGQELAQMIEGRVKQVQTLANWLGGE